MGKNLHRYLLYGICIMLAIIPFFWLKPGEMDLGGDSSRLYFYDPYNYFLYNLLYTIIPTGFNIEQPLILFAPFGFLLIIAKAILPSPYLLITLLNSCKLVIGFLAIYGIIQELLSGEKKKFPSALFFAGVFAGLYYIFSPIMVRTAWDKALITHAQIFLNPLAFYLMLRFIKTNKVIYILFLLFITVIFSVNFSWASAPMLLGFYPLSMLFLFLYARWTKIQFSYVQFLMCGALFVLLHVFHIVPLVVQILDKSGAAFARTFTSQDQFDVGLAYFTSIAPLIKVTENLLALPQMVPNIIPIKETFFLIPAILMYGLWSASNKKWAKSTRIGFFLLFGGYLMLFFLITANITHFGFDFYKSLFKVPGFSMFRNFYGQWMFGYLFFLSLLIGYTVYFIASTIRNKKINILLGASLLGILFVSAFPFVRGDMINLVLNSGQKKEFKIPMKMDHEYEQVLDYIRSEKTDVKYFTLPFTEGFHQQLAGTQNGMYQGPSTISLLTGHSDFSGYQVVSPFSELLLLLAREKKYKEIGKMLGLWNVGYIFHNSDNNILTYFPDFPYQYVKESLPRTQKEYQSFIDALPVKKKKDFGEKYHIYQLSESYYLPLIYIPKKTILYRKDIDGWGNLKSSFFHVDDSIDPRVAYVEDKRLLIHQKSSTIPKIRFEKINPTLYKINIKNAEGPYVLVLSQAYNPNWKVYVSPKEKIQLNKDVSYFGGDIVENTTSRKYPYAGILATFHLDEIAGDHHVMTNAFSNGWLIRPVDVGNKKDYVLIVEFKSQQYLYMALLVSSIAFVILMSWISYLLVFKKSQ